MLDLFDSLRPNISLDEILEQERQEVSLRSNVTPKGYQKNTPPSESMATLSEESMLNIKKFPLKKAIEKYPRIMNQRVTDADIVFRGSDGAVVPSVKNWITTYHQEMGSGAHEPFERSQFLFHNKNAVMLSQQERNILSEILRSLDEESELPLNIETQTIDILQLESDNSSMAPAPDVPENPSPQKEGFFPQKEGASTIPQPSNRAIPPAERSEASFSTREPIDDRRDTWHNDSEIFLPKENSERRPSFASKLSFTEHSSPETPLKQYEIPASAPTRGTAFLTPNANIARERSPQVNIPQKPNTNAPEIPAFGKNINFSSFPKRGSSTLVPEKAEIAPLNAVSERNTLRPRPSAPPSSTQPSLASRIQATPPQQTTLSPSPSKPSSPLQSTQQVDYTDYYPIPKEPKTQKQPIAQNISFSSAHAFPVEKQQAVAIPKDVRNASFFPLEKQAPPAPTNQTPPQQVPPAKQSPKRMIIG